MRSEKEERSEESDDAQEEPEDIDTFRIIVMGCTGSGKTHLVKWLLREMDEDYLDELFVYSSTASAKTWPETTPSRVFTEWSPELVQKQINRPGHKLFIVDDMIGVMKPDDATLVTLFTKGRHHGTSVFLITQRITGFFPVIRANASEIYLCRTLAATELDALHKELATPDLRKRADWYAFIDECTKDHHALRIEMTNGGSKSPYSRVKPTEKLHDLFVEPATQSDDEGGRPRRREPRKRRKAKPLPSSLGKWKFQAPSSGRPPKSHKAKARRKSRRS